VLMDADDASQRFCEEDIDQILERRTKIVRHSEGGNVFSKATFQVDEEIEDPYFWDNLLNQKKSEESEGRIKRQCRRLSREGNVSDEDRAELEMLYTVYVENKDPRQTQRKMSAEELEMFRVFVTVLHKGVFEVGVDIFADTFDRSADKLRCLIKYCVDLLPSQRLKNDFGVGLERLYTDYDPHLFTAQADVYLKHHEKFLFKIQVPLIVKGLASTEELFVEKTRGWSHEDDKALVNLVLKKGYDNFSYKEKSREDINQRVRKIISFLSHKKEIRENDNMYFRTIMNFGRLTDDNELAVEKFLKKDTSKLKELVDKICAMTRRSRRDTVDAECFERIEFFDKLVSLEEIPNIRKIGMPRRWDSRRDAELRAHLLTDGFTSAVEKFGINEDTITKRFEMMFRSAFRANESSQ